MKSRKRVQRILEFLTDSFALVIANVISFLICFKIERISDLNVEFIFSYIISLSLSFIIVFLGFNFSLNLSKRSRLIETLSVLRNCLLTYMLFAVVILLTRNPFLNTRSLFVFSLAFYIVLSSVFRYILKRLLIYKFANSKMASLVGIVTVGERAEEFIEKLSENWILKLKGIALVDAVEENGVYKYHYAQKSVSDNGSISVKYTNELEVVREISGVPVIANSDNFMDWIRSASLDEVFLNIPTNTANLEQYVEELESMGITVHINIPVLENLVDSSKFDNIECEMCAGYPMATLAAVVHNPALIMIKRIVDLIGGFVGSLISLPIIAVVAIPLLIESRGPLIFKQQRVGKNGRIFNIYKLRSMYVDAEERKKELMSQNKIDGLMFKIDDDPRITKVGKFIRKTSIDELPQFWNVLKGDMSLVGTRPPTLDEFEQYESHHKRRLSMSPGITGMWQVSGRSDIQDFEEVVRLDCQYIDNWSLWMDLKILLKTVSVVLKCSGAE